MLDKIKKLIICILLITVLLTSCAKEAAYIDDESDDSPLTIYLLSDYDTFYISAIDKYNSMIKSGEIDGREIEVTEYSVDDIEDTNDKIFTEVLTGSGPDFLVVGPTSYSNIYKAMENNATADMDILIKNNSNFNADDYKSDIIDAGIIDGVRRFMPVGYSVPFILTTKENFEDCDIEIPDHLDIDSLLGMINSFNEQDKYFSSIYSIKEFAYINAICEYQINKTVDGEYFKKVYEGIKDIELKHPDYTEFSGYFNELGLGSVSAISINFSLIPIQVNQYNIASDMYAELKDNYNKTAVVMNMPCDMGEKTTAFVSDGLAININSKHKNDAFKFIMFLLSETAQMGLPETGFNSPLLPVNKKAYEKSKGLFINGTYLENYYSTEIPDEYSSQFINLVEDYGDVIFLAKPYYIIENVFSELTATSYEEAVKEIDNKLRLYFSE